MPRVSFQPIGDSWSLVVLALVALTVAVVVWRPNDPNLSAFRRRFETAARFAVVALFAVLFARPSLVRTEKEELPASVVVLCDLSESMSIRDEAGNVSRFDAMKNALAAVRDGLRDVGEKFEVRALGFGDSVDELEFDDGEIRFPERPTGTETPLGAAVAETLRETAGKRTLGVLLLSDGTQRTRDPDSPSPQDVALRCRDAERPIFAVSFGSTGIAPTTRDVAVVDLRTNDRVFLGNEATATGQVRLLGCAGLKIPLRLNFETEPGRTTVVDETILEPKSDDVVLPFKFAFAPQTPGEWKLSVSAPPQENELATTNNELGAFVEAVDGGLDVLYVEGTRRYEQNFLRAALESAADVRIEYWRPSSVGGGATLANATEAERLAGAAKSRSSLVDSRFAPGKYAAYVLGDVDASAFQPNELKALAKLVESGVGLIALGGDRTFGAGGYAETALADVFPTKLRTSDRLPLDADLSDVDAASPTAQKLRLDGDFRALPAASADAANGRDDFAVRLSVDPKKNAEIWRKLPPLNDVYRLGKPKPGATTLLTATGRPRTVGADGSDALGAEETLPLLVAQTFGEGRVATLATDSTWRWRMRGFEDEHRKFWRRLLLWVAKMDDLLEGELAVELDRTRFASGENVDFRVVYRPKPGENPTDLTAKAVVVAPDGTRTDVALVDENGVWNGSFRDSAAVGDYRIEAELFGASGGTTNGPGSQTAQARFLTFERNLELDEPAATPGALDNLAATSNGRTLTSEELGPFLTELAERRATIADYRDVKRSLYDSPFVFALFVGLFAVDWLLRRRWNGV